MPAAVSLCIEPVAQEACKVPNERIRDTDIQSIINHRIQPLARGIYRVRWVGYMTTPLQTFYVGG
jgi:hypothetical protein